MPLREIFILLAQSVFAGLIVAAYTQWQDNRRRKNVARKSAAIISIEISMHLRLLAKSDNYMPTLSTALWERHFTDLSSLLSSEQLQTIGEYYQEIQYINQLVDTRDKVALQIASQQPSPELPPISDSLLQLVADLGQQSLACLEKYQ